MQNLVFKYRSVPYVLIFLVNCLIPALVALNQLSEDFKFGVLKSLGSTFLSYSYSKLITATCFGIFLIIFLVYIKNSLSDQRKAASVLTNIRANSRRFWIGISSTFFSLNVAIWLAVTTICFLNNSTSNNSALKIVTYVSAGITFLTGLLSNVYLSMFEFKWNFDVFNARYRDSVIAQVALIDSPQSEKPKV